MCSGARQSVAAGAGSCCPWCALPPGLLKERALLLLLPLYPIGYVCTRLSRRTGPGRSLALTLPLSLLGALGVAVLGWWMAGRGTPLEALRSFRFYEALWPALCGNVRAAVTLPDDFRRRSWRSVRLPF